MTPPLVLIEWEDSHWRPGWARGIDDGQIEPVNVQSVGWLIHNGKEAKVIAAHISDENTPQTCGDMTIPARSILKIRKIK
jgi:hypothetical protein